MMKGKPTEIQRTNFPRINEGKEFSLGFFFFFFFFAIYADFELGTRSGRLRVSEHD